MGLDEATCFRLTIFRPATGLAKEILKGDVGFVWMTFLGLTICLAERTGLRDAASFGGVATLNGVAAVMMVTVFAGATALGPVAALIGVATLAGLSVMTLIFTGDAMGIIALTIFLSLPVLNERLLCVRLIFIIGSVVEVPQSVHTSLYSASLRPHFLQNGIYSLLTF